MRSRETIARRGMVFILSIALFALPTLSISTCCCANPLVTSSAGSCCCSESVCCCEPSASEAAPCCCCCAAECYQDSEVDASQMGDALAGCCCKGKCRCGDRSTSCAICIFSWKVKKPGVQVAAGLLDWTFVPADRDSRKECVSFSPTRGLLGNLRQAHLQVWLM